MENTLKLIDVTAETERHSSQIEENVSFIDRELGLIHSDLEKSKNLNESLHSLDSTLDKSSQLLGLVSIIPAISTSASTLKKTLDVIRLQVKKITKVSDKVEKVVKPTRDNVKKLELKAEKLDQAMIKTINSENNFISILGSCQSCIISMDNSDTKNNLRSSTEEVSKTTISFVETFDQQQVALINLVDEAKSKIDNIQAMTQGFITINNDVQNIMNILKPLVDSLKALEVAFKQTIRVPNGGYFKYWESYQVVWGVKIPVPHSQWIITYQSFTIKNILDGVTGISEHIMELFNKAMMDVLNPILRGLNLNINLPSIPGLDILDKIETELLIKFNGFVANFDNFFAKLNLFSDINLYLDSDIIKINSFFNTCQISKGQPPSLLLKNGDKISIQTINGQYLSAVNGGGDDVRADRDKIGAWETFTLEQVNGGFGIRTDNGHYLFADNGGGSTLNAKRTKVGEWETFKLNNVSENKFSLRSHNNNYICAEDGGGSEVNANRTGLGPWETFTFHLN